MFVSCERLCCPVEVYASGWSLIQRSPTDCGVFLTVIKRNYKTPRYLLWPSRKKERKKERKKVRKKERKKETNERTNKQTNKVILSNAFHVRALYHTKTLIANKCTKKVLSIVTRYYMFRPCWVIFRENFSLPLH
jgi:hypothetical protein